MKLFASFLTGSVMLASQAAAEAPIQDMLCSLSDQMTLRLSKQFRAERRGMGLRGQNQVMEIWEEPRTGDKQVLFYPGF